MCFYLSCCLAAARLFRFLFGHKKRRTLQQDAVIYGCHRMGVTTISRNHKSHNKCFSATNAASNFLTRIPENSTVTNRPSNSVTTPRPNTACCTAAPTRVTAAASTGGNAGPAAAGLFRPNTRLVSALASSRSARLSGKLKITSCTKTEGIVLQSNNTSLCRARVIAT